MPRKTVAEKAAEEAAAAEAARRVVERQRLMWAGLFLAAVAVFAGGYAIGAVGEDDTIVGADVIAAQPASAPAQAQAQAQAQGRGPGQGGPNMQAHAPGSGQMGQGMGRGQGTGGMGAGQGMGPGLGPDGTGTPGGGNVTRVPGQGPYGQNLSGECPFGIAPPQPGDENPAAQPGFLGVGVRQAATGVAVVEVRADSPGDLAGIEVGDVIVAVGDTPVETVGLFAQVIRSSGAGAEVDLTLLRSGVETTVSVVLAEIPA